jgi:hypothetical protein
VDDDDDDHHHHDDHDDADGDNTISVECKKR